jgi:zinc protease
VSKILVESSAALPLVNLSVSLKTGSVLDPVDREGLSEIVVRLMRRNAGGRAASENDLLVDSLGASLGADVVASTMGFHGTVISRSLDSFVRLLEETVCDVEFRQDDLERLKREMNAELVDSLDNDRAIAKRWFRRRMFRGHAYGRSVSGSPKSVAAIGLEDVERARQRLFKKDALVFACAGDIVREDAHRYADRIANRLPEGKGEIDPSSDPVGPKARTLVFVDKPERTQTQILIGCLGTHPGDDDHIALHVANTIFGGTFTARLTQEVRAKRGWSYGAYSSLPFDRRRHAFSMWTFPKATDAADCIKLELDMLAQWLDQGVTKKELAWAKRYLVRSHAFSLDTAAKRAGLALDSLIYDLPARYYDDYVEHVQAVTLEQTHQAVKNRISKENLLVAVVGTSATTQKSVEDAIDSLASTEVVAFDDLG